jgi:hypothetical protein
MGSFLNLEEEDVGILLEAYKNKKKLVEEQLEKLSQDLRKLNERIAQLDPSISSLKVISGSDKPIVYNREGTWNDKIKFVFSGLKKPLTTAEIVSQILNFQPELDKTAVTRSISATLTVGADKGLYIKEEREGAVMLYKIAK